MRDYMLKQAPSPNELYHHGILGMKWGVRRFQNTDGTLTAAGRARYSKEGLVERKGPDDKTANGWHNPTSYKGPSEKTKEQFEARTRKNAHETANRIVDKITGTGDTRKRNEHVQKVLKSVREALDPESSVRSLNRRNIVEDPDKKRKTVADKLLDTTILRDGYEPVRDPWFTSRTGEMPGANPTRDSDYRNDPVYKEISSAVKKKIRTIRKTDPRIEKANDMVSQIMEDLEEINEYGKAH